MLLFLFCHNKSQKTLGSTLEINYASTSLLSIVLNSSDSETKEESEIELILTNLIYKIEAPIISLRWNNAINLNCKIFTLSNFVCLLYTKFLFLVKYQIQWHKIIQWANLNMITSTFLTVQSDVNQLFFLNCSI